MTRKRFQKLIYKWFSPREANLIANWLMYTSREDRWYWVKDGYDVFDYKQNYDEMLKEFRSEPFETHQLFDSIINETERWTRPGVVRRNLHR